MNKEPKRIVYLDEAKDGWHVWNQEGEKIATFDPTATGTFFCGMFLGGISEGWTIKNGLPPEKKDAL